MWKNAFAFLQKIGKSLMLPVAVLPVAGLLLGIGSANYALIPVELSQIMARSGNVIFANLPLMFAIAVALGFTNNDGVSALAALVGYVVTLAAMGVRAQQMGVDPAMIKTIMDIPTLDTGVFGGILAGSIAAFMFNRYYRIVLPSYLGFFSGKRFVPIITAVAAVLLGLILAFIWPPIQTKINLLSHWAAYSNPITAATVYGIVERLLLPFGLHHIWNVPFFFQIGDFVNQAGEVFHGDIARFFAGDKTAGILSGGFIFKMWGLPAAAIAIWHSAKPENRTRIGSLMVSAALTSFLTGITEPIEFAFMFVAPFLYIIHAILVGCAFAIMNILGVHMGFTFSQGFIDFTAFFVQGTRPWVVLIVGPLFAMLYYGIFRFVITYFDLKTPGREEAEHIEEIVAHATDTRMQMAHDLIEAFGGPHNIESLDSCITRLRVTVQDKGKISQTKLTHLGASGVLMVGNGAQAIFGTRSENLMTDMKEYLGKPDALSDFQTAETETRNIDDPALLTSSAQISISADIEPTMLLAALGGRDNIAELIACAHTRLRVVLIDPTQFDNTAILASGVQASMAVNPKTWHLLVGMDAEGLAKKMHF